MEKIEFFCLKSLFFAIKIIGKDNSKSFAKILANLGPILGVSKVVRKNIEHVCPELGENAVKKIWYNFGLTIFEFAHLESIKEDMINIYGLDKIPDGPKLFFTAHTGNWEVLLRLVSKKVNNLAVVYRPSNNKLVDSYIQNLRSDNKAILFIPKNDLSKLKDALSQKMSIAMLLDQKMNDGISAPFFGKESMSPKAMAKIALKFNYPLIPVYIKRKSPFNFEVNFLEKIEYSGNSKSNDDIKKLVININQNIELQIKSNPYEWFWFHKRWPIKY